MTRTRIPIPPVWKKRLAEGDREARLATPIAEILPMRTVNALEDHGGVIYVEDLVGKTAEELAEYPAQATLASVNRPYD
jgi:hypothetical protein